MRKRFIGIAKKTALAALAAAAIAQALALSARFFVNTEALKSQITAGLGRQLHAQVSIGRLSLALWGMPRIVVHDSLIVFPNAAELTVDSATVYPALLPLLAGKAAAGTVLLDGPHLRIRLPGQSHAGPGKALPLEERQRSSAEALADAFPRIPSGELYISRGAISIFPPGDAAPLAVQVLAADISARPGRLTCYLSARCRLWRRLRLEAELALPARPPGADTAFPLASRITLLMSGVDIPEARRTALALAAHTPAVKSIFDRLQNGTIDSLACTAQLPVTADSLKNGRFSLSADFANISMHVPEAGISLSDVSGRMQVRDGSILAEEIAARQGESRMTNGTLRMNADRGYVPERIAADLHLDLAQLPQLLRFIPAQHIAAELARIGSPRGTARGSCTVTVADNATRTAISIDSLNLTAAYRGFPMPVKIDAGACRYSRGRISFAHLSGSMGNATLQDVSAAFNFAGAGRFAITSAQAELDLHELRAILASFSPTELSVQKLPLAEGSLLIKHFSLEGPIARPREWTGELQAEARNVTAQYAGIGGTIECPKGSLAITHNRFVLSQATLAGLDSRLQGGIALEGGPNGITRATVSARGLLGGPLLAKIFTDLQLPPALMVRPQAAAEQTQISWTRGGKTEFSGVFMFDRTARLELALRTSQNGFKIEKLAVRDEESNCTAQIGFTDRAAQLAYSGTLTGKTLDRILHDNRFVAGWIEGDFTADLNKTSPLDSRAQGTLSWEDAAFPGLAQMPVTVTGASVAARGARIAINSASVSAAGSAADIAGTVSFTEQGFILDTDVRADRLDLDRLIGAFRSDNESADNATGWLWSMRLGGAARVEAGQLSLAGYTFAPCNFTIDFADRLLTVTATDAQLCRIPVSATITIGPDMVTLKSGAETRRNDLADVLKCMSEEKAVMSGALEVNGEMTARGTPAALADSCEGHFFLRAKKGRIYRSNLLTKILSFLSIRELVTGGILNLKEKGFEYESLRIEGALQGTALQVRQAALVSSALNIVCRGTVNLKTKALELEALATPFQILDYALSKLPLVGASLKKTVIGIPLHIGGTMEEPKITPRAPTAVGREVMDLATDIIKLPIRLIGPQRDSAGK